MSDNTIIVENAQTCLETIRAGEQTVAEAEVCFGNTCKQFEDNILIIVEKKADVDSLLAATRNKIRHYEKLEREKQAEISRLNDKVAQLEVALGMCPQGAAGIAPRLAIEAQIVMVNNAIRKAENELAKIQATLQDLYRAEADLVEKNEVLEKQISQMKRDYESFKSEGHATLRQIKEQQAGAKDLLTRQYNAIMARPNVR